MRTWIAINRTNLANLVLQSPDCLALGHELCGLMNVPGNMTADFKSRHLITCICNVQIHVDLLALFGYGYKAELENIC